MVNRETVKKVLIGVLVSTLFIGCNEKNVEGKYLVLKKDKLHKSKGAYVIATLEEKTFSFTTGVGGSYEVDNNKVIMQGSFSKIFDIKEENLVANPWTLQKTTHKEIKVLQSKAKQEQLKNSPIIGDEKRVTKW